MKKILLFTIILLFGFNMYSQQESYYSLYRYNMQIVNPAYAGSEGNATLTFLNRLQWISGDNNPNTRVLTFSLKRKNNIGIGFSLVSDKVFIEDQTFSYVDISYKIQVAENSNLFFGLKAGGNFYSTNTSVLEDYNIAPDPAQTEFSRFNPNFGAGAYLINPKYWVSFSAPRIFNVNRSEDLNIGSKDRVHLYLGAGTYFKLNQNLKLEPSVLVRKVITLPYSIDFSTYFNFKEKISLGFSYRTKSSFSGLLLFKPFSSMSVGYAYETPYENNINRLGFNTHEILFKINLFDKKQEDILNNDEMKNDIPKKEIEVDSDSDGIPDKIDNCPDIKGTEENQGCPLEEEAPVEETLVENKKINAKQEKVDLSDKEYMIFFNFDSDEVKGDINFLKIEKLYRLISDSQAFNFLIEGYSSEEGSNAYNMNLSERRANSVRNELIKMGVDPLRISIKGFGEEIPIFDSTKQKNLNRTVKLSYIDKQ